MAKGDFFSGSANRNKRMAGSSDTKVALGGDNLGSFGGVGAVLGVGALGIKGIQSAIEGGKRLKENIQRRINPEEDNKQSFFSPISNEQKVAIGESGFTYESDTSFLDKDPDFNEVKKMYQGVYETLPGRLKKDIKLDYLDRNPLKYQEFLNRAEPKNENILNKTGNFIANLFTPPVAAATLDTNQQVFQAPERPKLSYVNPDAKTMSLGEIKEAFKPKNLFGYKDKFGRFDDPGSPLARDRAETMQRVAQNFNAPITADARTIGQIRADQDARMRENARLRNESFQRGERVKQKSADVTFGTNMLSNPAFGFRGKMTDAAKAKYDQSAKDATEMARTDPSLGNVAMQTFNRVSGFLGGPQASLESIGERQLRLANKEINRPRYQKEAYARKMLGITNDQLKARNMQQIQANAAARTQAFQNERVQRALEKAALRRGENVGTGRDGGFGLGTSGQGMPSNPKGFSGYSRKSSPSTGTGTGTGQSRSNTGSKSSARGARGSTSSRSRGGTGTGKSSQGSKSSARGARGSAGSRGRGGTGTGGSKSNTGSKRGSRGARRCDIRCKIDIASLSNQNLIKDDLAKVAYFVQELRVK